MRVPGQTWTHTFHAGKTRISTKSGMAVSIHAAAGMRQCNSWQRHCLHRASVRKAKCVDCTGSISSKFQVWWNVTPCRLVHSYRRFEGSQFLHLQGQAVHVELTHLKLLTLTRNNSQVRDIFCVTWIFSNTAVRTLNLKYYFITAGDWNFLLVAQSFLRH